MSNGRRNSKFQSFKFDSASASPFGLPGVVCLPAPAGAALTGCLWQAISLRSVRSARLREGPRHKTPGRDAAQKQSSRSIAHSRNLHVLVLTSRFHAGHSVLLNLSRTTASQFNEASRNGLKNAVKRGMKNSLTDLSEPWLKINSVHMQQGRCFRRLGVVSPQSHLLEPSPARCRKFNPRPGP